MAAKKAAAPKKAVAKAAPAPVKKAKAEELMPNPEPETAELPVTEPKVAPIKSSKWPATEVIMWSVESLIPYTNNARRHTDFHVGQLVESFKEFGWTIPILIDENGMILAGHARVMAAKLAGWKDVPVMIAAGWSAADKRAYVLADNQLTLDGGIDQDKLKAAMEKLNDAEFNLDVVGFTAEQMADIFQDIEPIQFTSDQVGPSTMLAGIKWKNRRIPIEPIEISQLNERLDIYVAKHGSSKGFVRSLFMAS